MRTYYTHIILFVFNNATAVTGAARRPPLQQFTRREKKITNSLTIARIRGNDTITNFHCAYTQHLVSIIYIYIYINNIAAARNVHRPS